MDTKKSPILFAFVFPLTFIIGILVSVLIGLRFHENVQLDWLVVFAVAIVLDLLITWRQNRDEKLQKGTAQEHQRS
jgi:Ca2+/Na+ antiporter